MKVGIIGSGIGGLAAAHFLQRQGCQVTLFEKLDRVGMDAHRLTFEMNGQNYIGDVPSRMFNELQWPELLSLYNEIGVEHRAVDPTQSFSRIGQPTYLTLDVANRPQLGLNLLTDRRLRKIASDAKRFQKQGAQDLIDGEIDECSFAEYLDTNKYSFEFVREFLFPTLSSTVLTCSHKALDNFPARIILAALKRLFDSPKLLRTQHGTADVVQRLTKNVARISTNTTIVSFTQVGDQTSVKHTGGTEFFDHLIVAVQANHVANLFDSISQRELRVLDGFQYENVEVVIHTDETLMPTDRKHWSTFNMVLPGPENRDEAMCNVWMNRFHDEWQLDTPVFQTIKPVVDPAPPTVLQSASLQRAVVSNQTPELWSQLAELHEEPSRRIWFAGSYAVEGLPLLETGVRSAKQIAQRIQRTAPQCQ